MYAPLLITVYDRLTHLKQCIDALRHCDEASQSTIYIASDAAYRIEDEVSVRRVRDYVRTIEGFKKVILINHEKNLGAKNNYMVARERIFKKHDRLITMEDDVVVGKGFLHFINHGLDKYYDDDRVVAICGYMMPGGEHIEDKPFFLNEKTPYGEGIWRHKEMFMDSFMSPDLAGEFLRNWKMFHSLEHQTPANIRALPVIAKGELSPADIQALLGMNKHGLFALFPPRTLSRSVGHDGTGLHSGINPELQHQLIYDGVVLIPDDLPLVTSKRVSRGIVASQSRLYVTIVNRAIFLGYNFFPGFYFFFRPMRNAFKSIRRALSF